MTRRRARVGFTLLEVVLALGIFVVSLAMLSQITWNGARAAVQSRLKSQALFRCESKLQEIVAGVEPLSDQSDVSFEDDPMWTWSVATAPTDFPDLYLVQVTVHRNADSTLGSASQTLQRWMRDPNVFIEAAEQAAALAAEQASSSSGSTSSGTSP